MKPSDYSRYFIRLSYNGSNYNGWQNQSPGKGISIQSKIEEALSILCRKSTELTGCGRTDAGVHARDYFAHFDGPQSIDKSEWIMKLNKMLPKDIAIHDIMTVHPEAHARFDAISRSYEYHLHTQKSPFLPYSFYYTYGSLDHEILNSAAALLMEYKDFATFCKTHTDVKTTLCRITESRWEQTDDHKWIYQITADRFLRGMVRLIVGMCLNVSRGKISIEQVRKSLKEGTRTGQDWSVPAEGLFLCRIAYPYLDKI